MVKGFGFLGKLLPPGHIRRFWGRKRGSSLASAPGANNWRVRLNHIHMQATVTNSYVAIDERLSPIRCIPMLSGLESSLCTRSHVPSGTGEMFSALLAQMRIRTVYIDAGSEAESSRDRMHAWMSIGCKR